MWILLDENGRFGAPPDVIGYRPFNEKWKPDDGAQDATKAKAARVDRWLVRKRTNATTPFTDQPGGGRSYNARWILVHGDFSPLPIVPQMWDVQLFNVPWIDRPQDSTAWSFNEFTDGVQHDRVFMACSQGEGWSIVDPLGRMNTFTTFATINGPADAVSTLTTLHQNEIARRAKIQKAREQYAAIKAAEAIRERRAWIDENWNRHLQSGNFSWCASVADERGRNSWYEIANAMGNPSIEFLNQVMARTTSDNLKQKIQGMIVQAEQRESQIVAAYWAREKEQERLRWVAAHPSTSATYGSSYRDTPRSGGSSIGGGMAAGWQVSDDQKRAYMKALGTSQHRANMGWSNPYGY